MTDGVTLTVRGLSEFSRDLRQLDNELPKALRLVLNDVAEQFIGEVRPHIPRRTGAARASLKPRSSRTQVRVSVGGRRAPYYPWLDFGGRVGKNRSVKRPFLKHGRYIYNAYFKNRDSGKFQEALEKGLLDVARQAGIEVD